MTVTTRRLGLAGLACVLVAGAGAVVSMVGATPDRVDGPAATRTTLAAVPDAVRPGEEVRLSGTVEAGDATGGTTGARVHVQQREPDGGFRTVQRVEVDGDRFVAWWRPDDDAAVRAVLVGDAERDRSVSVVRDVDVQTGGRSLDERSALVADGLGPLEAGSDDDGTRVHRGGAVVRAGEAAWTVRGATWDAYREDGGPDGALGAPTGDAWCGPLGGCVQRFTGGAVFHDPDAPEPTVVVRGEADRAAAEAAARSQVGYVEPSWRGSRWNDWVGDDVAWCGIFQSWASQVSGNAEAVPAARTFEDLVARTSADTAHHVAQPVVGALAFMDLEEAGHPTHVGLVTGADGTDVELVEGNVGPDDARAVVETTRTDPPVVYYWLPPV